MVVYEEKIGNTTVRYHDDAMVKTDEENQEILDRISRLVNGFYQSSEGQRCNKETTA